MRDPRQPPTPRRPPLAALVAAAMLLPGAVAAHPHGPGNGGSAPGDDAGARLDADGPLEVTVARSAPGPAPRDRYVLELVALALDAAGVEHELSLSDDVHGADTLDHVLPAGHHGADVAAAPPRADLIEALRPVYFPVQRGLPGHRLLVIARDEADRFRDVRGLDDLRALTGAVARGSGDRALLRHNGLPAVAVAADGLAAAVAEGRADYAAVAPRRALALAGDDSGRAGLALEQSLALAYRGDEILYAAPGAGDLVAAIDAGLMRAYRSGELAAFQREHPYLRGLIREAGLDARRTLVLDHPDVPRALQRAPGDLWLQGAAGPMRVLARHAPGPARPAP